MNDTYIATAVQAARRRPRRVILGLISLGVLIGLVLIASDRTTSRYWNAVHTAARQADAVKCLETPQEAITVLAEIESKLDGLDTDGVDPRALDAANRFRVAVVTARQCIEEGQWMLDHPVRTTVSTAWGWITGRGPLVKLHDRLVHAREVTVEAHESSVKLHSQLAWRFPLSRFKSPIPPDVHLIDEALGELKRMGAEGEEMSDQAYDFGRVLGAIIALLLGG